MNYKNKVGVNMKLKLKNVLLIILVVVSIISIVNVFFTPVSYAEDGIKEDWEGLESELGVGGWVLDGVVGLLLLPYKLGIVLIGLIVQVVTTGITGLGGDPVFSIEDIIFDFNRPKSITSIEFFDLYSGNSTTNIIRQSVATWYYAMRNLSVVILLGILIYVGIRMALSTVAEQEAKYKKMLVDWSTSIALVYVLHYIMIFTIEINKKLCEAIYAGKGVVGTATHVDFESAVSDLGWLAFTSISFSKGFGAAIAYVILAGITLIFLFMYIKRMLTIGFLIVIAPLITITYSIDKMGDGKSQALNAWLKEFVFNVLIQPFHCIIYLVFVGTAINLLGVGQNEQQLNISGAVLAIVMIVFIFSAEKIVKKIFNFQASSMGDAIAGAAFMGTAFSMMKNKNKQGAPDPSKIAKTDNKGRLNKVAGKPAAGGTANRNSSQPTSVTQKAPSQNRQASAQGGGTGGTGNGTQTPVKIKGPKQSMGERAKGKLANGGKALLNGGKNYLKNTGKHVLSGATLGMAALGLSTGSTKGAIAGYSAGKGVTSRITDKLKMNKADKLVRQNQESFAGAYSNYQQKFNKNDFDMKRDTMRFSKMSEADALTELNQDEYEYWADVQKMKGTFDAVGDKDSNQSVLDTVNAIQAGEIEASFDGIENWEEPPLPPETETKGLSEGETSGEANGKSGTSTAKPAGMPSPGTNTSSSPNPAPNPAPSPTPNPNTKPAPNSAPNPNTKPAPNPVPNPNQRAMPSQNGNTSSNNRKGKGKGNKGKKSK